MNSVRYPSPVEEREVLATGLVYHDGKVNLPRKILETLNVKAGSSRIIWVRERSRDGDRVYIEPAVKTI